MTPTQSIASPDGSHVAKLKCIGEVRWGPPYFSLEVDDHSFGDRIFGDSLCWSDDSLMLAIQEWMTLDYARGPITQLTVLDIALDKQCALAKADKGFIFLCDFSDRTVSYQEEYWADSEIEKSRHRVELPLPGRWTWLDAPLRIKKA